MIPGKIKNELTALVLFVLGSTVTLALLSHSQQYLGLSFETVPGIHDFGGAAGLLLASTLFKLFGWSAFLLPMAAFMSLIRLLRTGAFRLTVVDLVSFPGLWFASAALLDSAWNGDGRLAPSVDSLGGRVGAALYSFVSFYMNDSGAVILFGMLLVCSFMVLTGFSLGRFVTRVAEGSAHAGGWLITKTKHCACFVKKVGLKLFVAKPEHERSLPPQEVAASPWIGDGAVQSQAYQSPPLDLLRRSSRRQGSNEEGKGRGLAPRIEDALRTFGVEGRVNTILPGPVVTRFEFSPASGIKLSKISGLADDLALVLRAKAVRIVAPIPGKGVVGIELPNDEREEILLGDVLDSEQFQRSSSALPVGLGVDQSGIPHVVDLSEMPHLLIAGTTGSGKSVCLNGIILSCLFSRQPEDLRLILIDPKCLEFAAYRDIPHLLLPVVTRAHEAVTVLSWVMQEMTRRYELMAKLGCRGIASYNKALKDRTPMTSRREDAGQEDGQAGPATLYRIVVVVDELSTLIMSAGREVEVCISRLAAMARAAGIHLVLATQRPSVDVLTGLIKANLPTRIAFKVASAVDSRTCLDQQGAESLLGRGDMLLMAPGETGLRRLQGAFVGEDEVEKVCSYLKGQGAPDYLSMPSAHDGSEAGAEDEEDEKYDQALNLVRARRKASISFLQRNLRVGYNRAARMIEKMERDGLVGPSDGSGKPREVLLNKSTDEN